MVFIDDDDKVIDNTYFESLERISIEKGYTEIIMSKVNSR